MRVLIVEDDPGIARGVAAALKAKAYAVDICATLGAAEAATQVERFDLVLLDLSLPDGDGLEWLRRLRAHASKGQTPRDVPVLIMTARDALPDRIAGLDQGADDYLIKPFDPEELLARMRAALRRNAGRASPLLHYRDLVIDPAAQTVERAGQPVVLRAKEFALLMALLQSSGQVLNRTRLEEALYGFDDAVESNALEVHVHHLRKKLGEGVVQTVRGVGYFMPQSDDSASARSGGTA